MTTTNNSFLVDARRRTLVLVSFSFILHQRQNFVQKLSKLSGAEKLFFVLQLKKKIHFQFGPYVEFALPRGFEPST